jgi:netrin 1
MCLLKIVLLNFLFLCGCLAGSDSYVKSYSSDPCYNDKYHQKPQMCLSEFVNAAFNRPISASSTCGLDGPVRYCDGPLCGICDDTNQKLRFPASALTDINNSNNVTCWRSEPTPSPTSIDAQPDNVTLTLSLGKKFELTYVSLVFCQNAIKPDSLVIYKSSDYGKTWIPYQFYSSNCRKFYGRANRATITKLNEQEALCSDSHRSGDTSSYHGSRIAFSMLEGRPSAPDFDTSPILQDWVTATDIKVVFHRLQIPQDTDQDQDPSIDDLAIDSQKPSKYNNKDDGYVTNTLDNAYTTQNSQIIPFVTQSYAIADLSVGGRCKCNGHASKCIKGSDGQLECDCKHNTDGRDCERCKMFYFDRPWGRATIKDANECKSKLR